MRMTDKIRMVFSQKAAFEKGSVSHKVRHADGSYSPVECTAILGEDESMDKQPDDARIVWEGQRKDISYTGGFPKVARMSRHVALYGHGA